MTAAGEDEEATGPAGAPACSDAERWRAAALARGLEESGRSVRTVTLWVRPYWWAAVALCAAAGVLASVAGVDNPAAGLAVSVAAAVLAAAEVTRRPLLRLLTPARATQNVVSTAPPREGSRAVTLLVTAAVDDPRRRLGARLPLRPAAIVAGGLTLVAATLLVRLLSEDPGSWLDVLQLVPTLVLLAAFPLLLDEGLGTLEPDAAVPQAATELAARLDAAQPEHLDVALVLAGAGAQHAAGLRGWLTQRRRRGLDRADVAILHLEPRAGAVWWERDGPLYAARLHPQLVAAARAAASGWPDAHATSASDTTGAGIARADGWAAIAVGEDVGFAIALVRELDSALDGAAGAADGGGSSLRP